MRAIWAITFVFKAGYIPQSLQVEAQRAKADVTGRKSARSRVRVERCVSAVRAVHVPVCVC